MRVVRTIDPPNWAGNGRVTEKETQAETPAFEALFVTPPAPLTDAQRKAHAALLTGVCLASDAFFPFRDNIDVAARFGVGYIAHAGGSVQRINHNSDREFSLVFESGLRRCRARMMESVLKVHGPCESLELSIVRIGLETYRSYEEKNEMQIDTVVGGRLGPGPKHHQRCRRARHRHGHHRLPPLPPLEASSFQRRARACKADGASHEAAPHGTCAQTITKDPLSSASPPRGNTTATRALSRRSSPSSRVARVRAPVLFDSISSRTPNTSPKSAEVEPGILIANEKKHH